MLFLIHCKSYTTQNKLFQNLYNDEYVTTLHYVVPRLTVGSFIQVCWFAHGAKRKLMLKMVRDTRFATLETIPVVRWCLHNNLNVHYTAMRYVHMQYRSRLFLCIDPVSGERGVIFSKRIGGEYDGTIHQYRDYRNYHFYMPVSANELPPFEKHSYPSYEYTDKKKKARLIMQNIDFQ